MGDKEIKEKAEKLEKKAEDTKEKIEKKAEEVKENVKDDVKDVKKEAKDLKENVEEKFDDAKDFVKKNDKKIITVSIIAAVVLLVLCIIIAIAKSPKAKVDKMFETLKRDKTEFTLKYEPNRAYKKEQSKILNSRTKYKIKKIEQVNKDKYKVEYTRRDIDKMKVLGESFRKAEEDKKYKKNATDNEDIKRNQEIILNILKKEVKKADINSHDDDLTFLKDTDGNWTVEEFNKLNKGL